MDHSSSSHYAKFADNDNSTPPPSSVVHATASDTTAPDYGTTQHLLVGIGSEQLQENEPAATVAAEEGMRHRKKRARKAPEVVTSMFGLIEDVKHPYLETYELVDYTDNASVASSASATGSSSKSSLYSKQHSNNYLFYSRPATSSDTFCSRFVDSMYAILEMPHGRTPIIGRIINFILFALIVISIISFVISTEPFVLENPRLVLALQILELVCIVIFFIEYVFRFAVCTSALGPYHKYGQVCGRFYFLISVSSIIDILSIVPTLAVIIVEFTADKRAAKTIAYRGLMALRILRILRLLKAEKYFKASVIIKNVILRKRRELFIALFVYIVAILFSGTAIFIAESDDQPTEYGSILAGIYWACIALSTGNIGAVPISPLGKFINVLTSVSAVAFVAIPTSILGAGFVEELEMRVAAAKEEEEARKKQEEEEAAAQLVTTTTTLGDESAEALAAAEKNAPAMHTHSDKALKCPHCDKPIHAKFDISLSQ